MRSAQPKLTIWNAGARAAILHCVGHEHGYKLWDQGIVTRGNGDIEIWKNWFVRLLWYNTDPDGPHSQPWLDDSMTSKPTHDHISKWPVNTAPHNRLVEKDKQMTQKRKQAANKKALYLVEEEYLVTALVPSETACLASSPGRISRTLWKWSITNFQVNWESLDLRGLNLARWDGGLLVVGSKLGGFSGNALKNVVDEWVEDAHGTVWDTGVGVHLFKDCGARQSSF